MLGIMHQPSPEKICTFQAAVMAASQLAESCIDGMTMTPLSNDRQKVLENYRTLIRMLEDDLNGWVEYILEKKVLKVLYLKISDVSYYLDPTHLGMVRF